MKKKKGDVRAAAERPRLSTGVLAVAIVAVVCAVYARGIDHPLMFDDLGAIAYNSQIRSLAPVAALAPPPETPVGGRPLVNLSFALNYAAGGLEVRGYRLVNIGLHALTALLLFGLVGRLVSHPRGRELAAAVALVWAVHPLNSEAVSYLTQRTELLMACCYLLTLYAAVRADQASGSRVWTAVAVAACAAGMASKESMVSAPLMVVFIDRVYRYTSLTDAWRSRRGLYLGLAATWAVLAVLMWSVPRTSGAGFATTHVSTWTYLLNQTEIILRYLRLTVWPDALVLYYGWATPRTLAEVWPSAVGLVAVLGASLALFVRAPRYGLLALWVFITLAPTSSFVPIASEVGAERRMYLPLMGLVTLALAGAALFAERRRFRVPLAAVLVLVLPLGYLTMARLNEYASPLTMAQTVFDRWPVASSRYMLGTELVSAGRAAEAVPHLRVAAAEIPPARYNFGSALLTIGQRTEGIAELQAFLRAESGLGAARDARLLLARAFAEADRPDHAEAIARAVRDAAPND